MERKKMAGTVRTKKWKRRKWPELQGQSNGKEENVRNCTDKVMERKKMSGTARTK